MTDSSTAVECFISAGEVSGDVLAAQLVNRLKSTYPRMKFSGIVGEEMKKVGVDQIIPMESLRVMGIFDVIKNIYKIRKLESYLIQQLIRNKPRVAILVDFPGFHFRIAEQLKNLDIKVIQYVAPKVWAWGSHRIALMEKYFDLVMGIFPFEVDFFSKTKVPYKFVGCSHLERLSKIYCKQEDLGLNADLPVIACLPGSRPSEVQRILPVMMSLIEKFIEKERFVQFCIPIAEESVKEIIMSYMPDKLKGVVHLVSGRSLDVMKVSRLALVASGTATLECALLNTPMVVLYKLDRFSYFIAKKKVKLKWVSLVNIILDRPAVSEYIQDIPEKEALDEIWDLFSLKSHRREKMLNEFEHLTSSLSEDKHNHSIENCISKLLKHDGL